MKNKVLFSTLYSLMLVLIFTIDISAQDKATSNGTVPTAVYKSSPVFITPANSNNYAGRAFAYNSSGLVIPKGPFKFFLNNPSSPISLAFDPNSSNFVAAGSFDVYGNWWGVRYGNLQVVKIDTSTGAITTVGTVTGATNITGLAWDFSTSTMYASNYNNTNSTVGTLNLTTFVFTPLPSTITGLVIGIACSNSGQLYGVEINNDKFISINKVTGASTVVGPLGINANYAQDISWDHSVDSCYWASYISEGELRKINHVTGASTLIGAFNMEVDGLAIPGTFGPIITHTPYPNTQNTNGPYIITVNIISPGSVIVSAKLFWSRNSAILTDSVNMVNTSGSNWTGSIPGDGTNAIYRYRVKAIDALGRTAYAPSSAESYSFLAQAFDTSHSVIVTTPITSCPIYMWPANVKASVSNIFGIDSVWVKWYKNYPSNGWKRFNLSHGTGNNWSGIFNSNSSEVNFGDSISYRIIARNASTQHNLDSTALYTFMIDLGQNPIVGTDTLSGNFPFTTYWMDGRTDYLYTHQELNNLPPIAIWGIGFDIINANSMSMNEFTIKMQNTTATSISGFTESGWTTVYSNVYTVSNTGWQIINLTTPFFTNGTNVLVEICYNNSSYSNYSTVRTSPTAGNDYWGRYGDLVTAGGCGYTAWTSSVGPIGKANTIFKTIIDNIENTGTGIPETYALTQNYPNPFNPVTKINFSIPKSGMVSLKVYDILGKEVSTLVNQNISAGTYTYEFDASRLSSGIYFYRLNVNGFSEVKKMSLIK